MQTETELVEMIEEDLKYEDLYYEEIVNNLYEEFDPELSLIYIKNDITNLFNSLKDSNIKIKYLKELKEILNNI